jgi:hypothetical protein
LSYQDFSLSSGFPLPIPASVGQGREIVLFSFLSLVSPFSVFFYPLFCVITCCLRKLFSEEIELSAAGVLFASIVLLDDTWLLKLASVFSLVVIELIGFPMSRRITVGQMLRTNLVCQIIFESLRQLMIP